MFKALIDSNEVDSNVENKATFLNEPKPLASAELNNDEKDMGSIKPPQFLSVTEALTLLPKYPKDNNLKYLISSLQKFKPNDEININHFFDNITISHNYDPDTFLTIKKMVNILKNKGYDTKFLFNSCIHLNINGTPINSKLRLDLINFFSTLGTFPYFPSLLPAWVKKDPTMTYEELYNCILDINLLPGQNPRQKLLINKIHELLNTDSAGVYILNLYSQGRKNLLQNLKCSTRDKKFSSEGSSTIIHVKPAIVESWIKSALSEPNFQPLALLDLAFLLPNVNEFIDNNLFKNEKFNNVLNVVDNSFKAKLMNSLYVSYFYSISNSVQPSITKSWVSLYLNYGFPLPTNNHALLSFLRKLMLQDANDLNNLLERDDFLQASKENLIYIITIAPNEDFIKRLISKLFEKFNYDSEALYDLIKSLIREHSNSKDVKVKKKIDSAFLTILKSTNEEIDINDLTNQHTLIPFSLIKELTSEENLNEVAAPSVAQAFKSGNTYFLEQWANQLTSVPEYSMVEAKFHRGYSFERMNNKNFPTIISIILKRPTILNLENIIDWISHSTSSLFDDLIEKVTQPDFKNKEVTDKILNTLLLNAIYYALNSKFFLIHKLFKNNNFLDNLDKNFAAKILDKIADLYHKLSFEKYCSLKQKLVQLGQKFVGIVVSKSESSNLSVEQTELINSFSQTIIQFESKDYQSNYVIKELESEKSFYDLIGLKQKEIKPEILEDSLLKSHEDEKSSIALKEEKTVTSHLQFEDTLLPFDANGYPQITYLSYIAILENKIFKGSSLKFTDELSEKLLSGYVNDEKLPISFYDIFTFLTTKEQTWLQSTNDPSLTAFNFLMYFEMALKAKAKYESSEQWYKHCQSINLSYDIKKKPIHNFLRELAVYFVHAIGDKEFNEELIKDIRAQYSKIRTEALTFKALQEAASAKQVVEVANMQSELIFNYINKMDPKTKEEKDEENRELEAEYNDILELELANEELEAEYKKLLTELTNGAEQKEELNKLSPEPITISDDAEPENILVELPQERISTSPSKQLAETQRFFASDISSLINLPPAPISLPEPEKKAASTPVPGYVF